MEILLELKKKKVMHRDIKPENILFRSKDDVVLSDFGLSISGDNKKIMYPKCGTPGYVAPEIINIKNDEKDKANYGCECDMYSLGAVFYFMYILLSLNNILITQLTLTIKVIIRPTFCRF